MSAIAVPGVAALQAQSAYKDEDFSGISGNFAVFLPRLQLFTANSDPVKEGKIGVANYGLVEGKDGEITEIGKTILVVPMAWRPKAMFVKSDPVLAYHNPNSDEFKAIKIAADRDSNSGNLYGPEFLLWLPDQKKYATFYCASKTARNAAPSFRALCPTSTGNLQAGLMSAEYIKTSEYSWHGPKIVPSAQSYEGPPLETIEPTVVEFLKPKDSVVKKAEDAAQGTEPEVR